MNLFLRLFELYLEAVDFKVNNPPVFNVPELIVKVPVIDTLPLLIVAPALLFNVKLLIIPTPSMFCSAAPFKTTLPVIVPPLVNASVTFIVPLFVTVTPDAYS
jgi:hypothetical protein